MGKQGFLTDSSLKTAMYLSKATMLQLDRLIALHRGVTAGQIDAVAKALHFMTNI